MNYIGGFTLILTRQVCYVLLTSILLMTTIFSILINHYLFDMSVEIKKMSTIVATEKITVQIHEYFEGYFGVLLSAGFDKVLFFHLQQSHRQYPS